MLRTRRARWSSPALFNDPFDCYFSIELKFNLRHAAQEYYRRFYELIYQKEAPALDPTNRFAANIHIFRQLAQTTPVEVMKRKAGDLVSLAETLWREPGEIARAEWKTQAADLRVFCVCAEHKNVLLWSHYADCHRGVAFELDGGAEAGIPLAAAMPVLYSNQAPALNTRKEFINILLGLTPLIERDLFNPLVRTKAKSWAYEKEWRICLSRREGERKRYADWPFRPSNVKKLLLGCKISPRQRNALLRLVVGPFKHVEVHQAKQSFTKFELTFERIR
jgi:DUF2971 family protein